MLGGQVHEKLRSYTYIYTEENDKTDVYHDAELSAERAAKYVQQGFTVVKFSTRLAPILPLIPASFRWRHST